MNNLLAPILAISVLLLLFVLERLFPLRRSTRSFLARIFVNIVITALAFVAAVVLVQPAVHWALRWSADKPFGLVHIVALPGGAEFALCFLLMDLWRFHNVHHIDPDLDVSHRVSISLRRDRVLERVRNGTR
ncbi:MAG: hypothetical protein ABR526_06740 [Chthoniobacterales bacterium]